MGAPVVHFEITGGTGNQLERFYGELFGWEINSNNPMKYGVVETGGGSAGIHGGVGAGQDGGNRVSGTHRWTTCRQRWICRDDKFQRMGTRLVRSVTHWLFPGKKTFSTSSCSAWSCQ
jgi:hypothetical protein